MTIMILLNNYGNYSDIIRPIMIIITRIININRNRNNNDDNDNTDDKDNIYYY